MVCVYLRNYLRRYSAAVGPVVRVKATFYLPYLRTALKVLTRHELRRLQMGSRVSAGAKRLSAPLVRESEAVHGNRRRGG